MTSLPAFIRILMQRRFALIAGSLALIGIILGSSAAILSNLRESTLANVENALARRSLMLAAQADLSLQTFSQVMASIADYVAHEDIADATAFHTRLAGEDVHRILKERITGDVQIAAVGFFDTSGKLVNTSRIWPAPNIRVSDRGHHDDLQAGIRTGRYISKPFKNRITGAFNIAIAQPIKNRAGETIGHLTGVINLSYFEKYWQAALDRDEFDSSISLNRLDGIILARYPNNDLVGMRFERGIQNKLKEAPSAVVRRISQIDGKPRIESAHVLQSYPLFIRASETEETALRNWVRTAQMTGVIVACFILVVLMAAYGLWRRGEENDRRARMEAEKLQLEKARLIAEAEVHRSREAEVQARRLNAAVENMTQGLIMFDADERLVVINERFVSMYGLSRDIVKPGCAFRDVIAYRHALGQLKNPPEHYYATMAALQKSGTTAHHTSETLDGRVISVFNRAIPGGGWVGTHEDITDLQRQEEALRDALSESQETRLHLDAALNNMTQGLIMYDAQERVVVVNLRYLKMYDLSPDVVKSGITLREIIAHRARIGQVVGNPDTFCDIIRKKRSVGDFTHTQELTDGRIISIVNRPMVGGGWVVTHEDVTLLKKNEAALQEALGESRETQILLDAALNNMTHGLVMCDAQSNVVVFNSEYLKMYGLPQDLKPGMALEDMFKLRATAGSLPASFQHSGTNENYIAHVLNKVGADRRFDATTTLPDGRQISIVNRPMAQGGWVATHQDVTALLRNEQKTKSALEESRAARIQLDAAINNMSQGLVMCDEHQNIVVVNDKYIQMYGLSPDVIKPGCSFSELIRHRAATGHLADDPEQYCESVLARVSRKKAFEMNAITTDGREVFIHNRPMAGGGWLATHQDISDQKQAARQLEETRRFLDTIVENAPVAIVVKDAHTRRVVLVNRAYEELVGKDRSELVGKSAHQIYSPIKAPIVARRDEEKLRSDHVRVKGDTWIDKPDGTTRSVSTTSFVVRDNEGSPLYLIVVIEDITERKKSEARIAHMAHHDGLTNLPNRLLLHERLKEMLGRISAEGSLAVLYLDLDHFKRVNDTLGHIIGNELLKVVADRLRGCVGGNDFVARLSGDEFLIVRGNMKSSADAAAFAQMVRETVASPIILDGNQIFTDISIGIAVAPEHGNDVPQLMKCADMALYAAKSDGRGTFRFFEPAMSARMNERRALELDLRKAIETGELELYYQPLVKLGTDEIGGFEALLRWHHPERGLISPTEFIPIAEETGLIGTIGHWALRTACLEAATWPDNVKVAVNVSPVQFKNSNLAFSVASILAASGLSPRRLEIEITEAVLMDDNETTLETLHRLHDLGVRIAMDDFGTGYSSLSYLRSFPFDKIKIDRSFIKDLCENEDSVAIVRSIASLANSLNIITTAEGVETQAQLEWVRALGCTEAQGYHFGHPKRGADLSDYFLTGGTKPGGARSAA